MKSFYSKRAFTALSAFVLQATGVFGAINISSDPADVTVADGAKITLNVTATTDNGKPLTYTWKKVGVATPVKPTATTSSFVINAAKGTDAGNYFVTVAETGAGATTDNSNEAVVVVNVRPKISQHPTAPAIPPTAGPATDVNFVVTLDPVEGVAPFTYNWQKKSGVGFIDLATVTKPDRTDNYAINGVQLSNAGTYRVQITNASNIVVNSKEFIFKVNSAPVITTNPPATATVVYGATGPLKVVAGGNAPFAYKWFKNGIEILKSNVASLNIKGTDSTANGVAEGPGTYKVRVTNAFTPADQFTESSETVVRVIRKPKIQVQPAKATVSIMGGGVDRQLDVQMVTEGDEGLFQYQWYKDNKIIVGATNSILAFTPVTWNDRGSYKVIIKNEVGTVTSTPAVLTVVSPPIITSQSPLNVFGATKGSAKLFVVATGTTPLIYKWRFRTINGTYDPNKVIGKAANLTISGLSNINHKGYYQCTISNTPKDLPAGEVVSQEIYVQADDAPKITKQTTVLPYNATPGLKATTKIPEGVGNKLHLKLEVSGTNRPADDLGLELKANEMTFKWFKNKVLIPGATASEYIVNDVTSAATGSYYCEAANFVAKVTSTPLAIIVSGPPSITTQPADKTGVEESTIDTSVVAQGSGTIKYQWQKFDDPSWNNVVGKTAAKLTIANLSVLHDGDYRCVVTNEFGSSTSNSAKISVDLIPAPIIKAMANISGVEYFPRIARDGEKVRIFGENLQYPATVTFGGKLATGAVVYEAATSSLLVTVPPTAPTTPSDLIVTTKGRLSSSLGGGSDTATAQFTRTADYANDPANATILTPAVFTQKQGDNSFRASSNIFGDVYYVVNVPKRSFINIQVDGLVADFSNVDPGLLVFLEDPIGTLIGPDGFTRFSSNPRRSNIIGQTTEIVSFVTTEDNQQLLIEVLGSIPPGIDMVSYGPFALAVAIQPANVSSSTVASSAPPQTTKVKVGVENWQASEEAGKSASSSPDSEGFPTVRLGGEGTSTEPVQLWADEVETLSGVNHVVAGFRMSLEGGSADGDDQFAWQISGADGNALGAFWVNAATGEMRLVEANGTIHESTQHMTPGGGAHRFEVTIDATAKTWSGTIDGVEISEPAALPAGAKFGGIYAAWDMGADATASGAAVIFSDFSVEGQPAQ